MGGDILPITRDNLGRFTGGSYWQEHKGDTRLQGPNHWNWSGDTVGYSALHKWARKQFAGPDYCWLCGKTDCRVEMACINKVYTRSGSTWAKLCVRCHHIIDGHPFSPWKVETRRKEVYRLIAAGNTTSQIAKKLGVSKRTILRDVVVVRSSHGASED